MQGREVHRDCPHALRSSGLTEVRPEVEHQHGLDLDSGIGCRSGQGLGDERWCVMRGRSQHSGVTDVELHVGDHAEVAVGFTLHDDKVADSEIFCGAVSIQPNRQTSIETTIGDTARLFLLRSFAERVKTIPLRARALSTMSSTSRLSVVEMTACS